MKEIFPQRYRPVDLDRNLKGVENRQRLHLLGCIDCLRHGCGIRKDRCATGRQIEIQRQTILRAIKNKEVPIP